MVSSLAPPCDQKFISILGAPGYPELVFQFPEGDFTFGGMIAGKKV